MKIKINLFFLIAVSIYLKENLYISDLCILKILLMTYSKLNLLKLKLINRKSLISHGHILNILNVIMY